MKMSEIQHELWEHGFELIRSKKHQIWEDSAGHRIVLTSTKPTYRAVCYMMKQIKRMRNGEFDKLPTYGV